MLIVFGVLTLALAASALVNLNDPDPIPWVALYGAAAILTAWQAWKPGRVPRWLPAVVGGAALLWALSLSPHVLGVVRFGELWGSWEMHDARIEYGREFYGLLIAFGSMVLVLWDRRRKRA